MRHLALACVLLAGCIRGNAAFRCESNADCVNGGIAGTCEPIGYCSFGDATCPSGTRFGSLSGPYANQCVSPIPGDGPIPDAPQQHDAFVRADAPVAPPTVTAAIAAVSLPMQNALTYNVTIPASDERYLIVHVQLPTDCSTAGPSIASVTFQGLPLSKLDTLLGTPCDEQITLSEEWGLVDPPEGTAPVVITLSDVDSFIILSAAIGFSGIDQQTPIRQTASASGSTTSSTLDIAAVPGDLVVNFVGQGTMITAPGSGQTQLVLDNVDQNNNLDNVGVSSETATSTTTTMTWTFSDTDEWQTISVALRPAS